MGKNSEEHLDRKLRRRITGMFSFLLVEYIFGMFINLFGGDEDPAQKPLYVHVVFAGHVLIGIGLVVVAVFIFIAAREKANTVFGKIALYGLISIVLALIGGFITVILKEIFSEIGSFLMALSFIAAFIFYGYLFFLTKFQRNTA